MKKWILLAAGSVFMMNAHANDKMYCGYKDYFHISDQSNPFISVVDGYADPDVILQRGGPRSFFIRDGYQCRSGYAHVTVFFNNDNWCKLDIKDGPYMTHPSVTSTLCSGTMRYEGITYDGIGTYSYSINMGM